MCFSAVVDVSRSSGHISRFSWGGPHTLINFGLLACKWKRAKRIQTNKDQERNCQQPWLTGVGDCHDLTGSRLRVLTQLWYKIIQVLSLDQLTSVLSTSHPLQTAFLAHRLRLSTTTTPSSPPHLQDYLQYHSPRANAELPHISMNIYPSFHHAPDTSSQQCMRAMASERRIMLSSCRTVILQDDLVTPEPSRCRSRLYCSTMKSSDSLDICGIKQSDSSSSGQSIKAFFLH